jgi:hypothetical protein
MIDSFSKSVEPILNDLRLFNAEHSALQLLLIKVNIIVLVAAGRTSKPISIIRVFN